MSLNSNPNGILKIKINGDFGNGLKVESGQLGPVQADGTRYVGYWTRRKGRASYNTGGRVDVATGEFIPECNEEDLGTHLAVVAAALEQHK